jgi:hypothetical protein
MLAALVRAAGDPTLSWEGIRTWWDTLPDAWKLALLGLGVVLLVVGLVKRQLVLTFVAAVVTGGLLAWWWWTSSH